MDPSTQPVTLVQVLQNQRKNFDSVRGSVWWNRMNNHAEGRLSDTERSAYKTFRSGYIMTPEYADQITRINGIILQVDPKVESRIYVDLESMDSDEAKAIRDAYWNVGFIATLDPLPEANTKYKLGVSWL